MEISSFNRKVLLPHTGEFVSRITEELLMENGRLHRNAWPKGSAIYMTVSVGLSIISYFEFKILLRLEMQTHRVTPAITASAAAAVDTAAAVAAVWCASTYVMHCYCQIC